MSAADTYICDTLLNPDAGLEAALASNSANSLDPIDVAPNQGKLLYLLAKMNSAANILEVGTLGGYSAIWFAKALPVGGKLISLEIDPRSAEVARSNIKNAGYEEKVEIKVAPALESLKKMEEEEGWGNEGKKMDLVFIDADKENNVGYLEYAVKFAKKGTVIIIDNVGRKGRIADSNSTNSMVQGTRRGLDLLGKLEKEGVLEATAVQTVGSKGWDGFAVSLVVG